MNIVTMIWETSITPYCEQNEETEPNLLIFLYSLHDINRYMKGRHILYSFNAINLR